MAEHSEISDSKDESFVEKIAEKFHGDDSSSSSSSSDSDSEKKSTSSPSSRKSKIFRMFGREKPVHKVFGGGKRTYSSLSIHTHTHTHTRTYMQICSYTHVVCIYLVVRWFSHLAIAYFLDDSVIG